MNHRTVMLGRLCYAIATMTLVLVQLFCLAAQAYNIAPERVHVSGLSSGSFMAGQLHVAYSSTFKGAGLVAGGPYFCARGDVSRALGECSENAAKSFDVSILVEQAKLWERQGRIDPLSNMASHKIFTIVGENDVVVPPVLVRANSDFYNRIAPSLRRFEAVRVNHQEVTLLGHAMPTLDNGNSCDSLRTSPFISRCEYDAAGEILKFIDQKIIRRGRVESDHFYSFEQLPGKVASFYSLSDTGFAYVPASCQQGERCGLHVVLHGCRQTIEHIGRQFIELAGYNEWAEENHLIVVYPQAVSNTWIGNPRGCWDWWGYTGPNYANREGSQLKFIKGLVDTFSEPLYRLEK